VRKTTWVVFDEYVPAGTISSKPVYTGDEHHARLGLHDRLALHALIDNLTVNTTGNFSIFVEESADGKTWIQRNHPDTPNVPIDAQISFSLTSGATTFAQGAWSDACLGVSKGTGTSNCNGPLLGFVRLKMFFDANNNAGHVRVCVTQRDK
jgi:hypothetical protein